MKQLLNRALRRQAKKVSIDETSKRELKEVQNDYVNACALAGEAQFTIKVKQEELDSINVRINNLRQEATAIQAAKKEEQPESKQEDKNEAAT